MGKVMDYGDKKENMEDGGIGDLLDIDNGMMMKKNNNPLDIINDIALLSIGSDDNSISSHRYYLSHADKFSPS
jgi:hypothetical protein